MSRRKKKQPSTAPIYTFAILWLIMCTVTPVFKLGWLIAAVVIAGAGAYLAGRRAGKKAANEAAAAEETEKAKSAQAAPEKKSYGPEIDPIIEEGNRALSEMGRLYDIEKLTRFDLFSSLPAKLQNKIEAQKDLKSWR